MSCCSASDFIALSLVLLLGGGLFDKGMLVNWTKPQNKHVNGLKTCNTIKTKSDRTPKKTDNT